MNQQIDSMSIDLRRDSQTDVNCEYYEIVDTIYETINAPSGD